MPETKMVPIAKLLLSEGNPRYEKQSNQNNAIKKLALDQSDKLINLAEDITENGMDPSQNLLVTREGDDFVVLEGNRRIAALKLLGNPSLVRALNLSDSHYSLAK